jgi:hypothetical protein
MAKGNLNVGDEVAIMATVRRRVTESRISVSIPSYGSPHSIKPMELIGNVTYVDDDAGKSHCEPGHSRDCRRQRSTAVDRLCATETEGAAGG